MKRCPECGRDYYDDTLRYCLDDGNALLDGPAVAFENEMETAIYSVPVNASSLPPHPATKDAWPADRNSIAVLPFANTSPNSDAEYFADGLAEELLNVLARVSGLKVAARTSSFSFKGRSATISEVGRELRVAWILEGSVRMFKDSVRIAVQLVDVEEGYHTWAETYDRKLDNIFELQDDIAGSVVFELKNILMDGSVALPRTRILRSDLAKAVRGRPQNPQAQLHLLRGRYLLDRFNQTDVEAGIMYLYKAIESEPGCALIWAELSRGHGLLTQVGGTTLDEGFARSRECAERALNLDPDLADGHVRMGWIHMLYDWDLTAAAANFRRADAIHPFAPEVVRAQAALQCKLGDFERSIALNRRVLETDPLNAPIFHNLGIVFQASGDHIAAEGAFRTALEIAPPRFATHAFLSLTLTALGRNGEALDEANREPYEVYRLYASAVGFYGMKDRAKADAILEEMIEKHADNWAFQIAEIYAFRSDNDRAFDWLHRANMQRDGGMTNINVSSLLDGLRKDVRWAEFVNSIGIVTG